MKHARFASVIVGILAVALAAAPAAASLFVEYSVPYGPENVPDAGTTVSLSQFDPSLGTLLSVTLTLDAIPSTAFSPAGHSVILNVAQLQL